VSRFRPTSAAARALLTFGRNTPLSARDVLGVIPLFWRRGHERDVGRRGRNFVGMKRAWKRKMSKRQHQTDFLKALILHADSSQRENLLSRMAKAERDEHCTRCALILVFIASFVSFCAVCYSVVLLPDLLRAPSPTILKFICLFGFASSICSVAFFFYWLWYRGVLNRLQDETRRFILSLLEGQCQSSPNRMRLVALGQGVSPAECNGSAPYVAAANPQTYWELFRFKRAS
jgi:hypothetical protein